MEKKYRRKITAIDFRDKRFGWAKHFESVYMSKHRHSTSVFRNLFYNHYILRPSCHICPFANMNRYGDITLADAWGIEKTTSKFNDDKGCSLIILNNEKGREIFNKIADKLIFEMASIDDYLQPNLQHPSYKPSDRKSFWNLFEEKGFSAITDTYGRQKSKFSQIRDCYDIMRGSLRR